MELFTITANLIVLGVVSIALFVFRRSDRSSKTIEQAEMYAKKRYREFDTYVEEKITQLKDISLGLEVQEKTSKVILDRIVSDVDSLTGKVNRIDEINLKVSDYTTAMDKMISLSTDLNGKYDKLIKDSSFLDQLDKRVRDSNKKLTAIESNIDEITSEFIKNNNESVNRLKDELMASTTEELENISARIGDSSDSMQSIEIDIIKLRELYNRGYEEKLEDFNTSLNEVVENHRESLKKLIEDASNDEARNFKELQERIELRSTELEKEVDGRVDKINLTIDEINRNAESMKESNLSRLDSIKDQIDNQLILLKDINTRGLEDLKSDINRASELRDELKEKVYASEDYLEGEIRDLKERVDSSRNEFIRELDNRDEALKAEALKHLEDNLVRYKDEIDLRVEQITGLNMNFDNLVEDLNKDIESKTDQFREQFNSKLNDLGNFSDEIDRVKGDIEEILLENRNSLKDRVEGDKKELSELLDEFNRDKVILEEEINRLKENSYNNIEEKLNAFEDDYFIKLKEKEDYINSETERWKDALSNSVNEIKEESQSEIVKTMESITSTVENFESTVNTRYNEYRDEVLLNIENSRVTLAKDFEDMQSASKDSKERLTHDLNSLKVELEELNSSFSITSNEINSQIKDIKVEQERFVKESEIFSRTEVLRRDLREAIESLDSSIIRVNEKSTYVNEVNSKLDTLKALSDSINSTIGSIEGKRERIDTLEDKVQKVLRLSDSVEERLKHIQSSDDKLNDVQLKLRSLSELENEVTKDYISLQNKEDILIETRKAIDTSFANIEDIESRLEGFKENLVPVNNQIDNIKDKISRVQEKEGRLDKTLETISTLDSYMADLNNKIEKMNTAREWIAGVETRLNESVEHANEQVKLMGALSQNKTTERSTKDDRSVKPNHNMRDMVIKLAHNGWKAEDIARTTKLSRGEVELILELSPRK